MSERSYFKDALRILFVLVAGSTEEDNLPNGARGIFRAESRLHAFDFWMRYPDYFANELLDLYMANQDPKLLSIVQEIFDNDEPDIRKLQMIRYRFGAYERLDDVLSILRSRSLIAISGRKAGAHLLETDFLIMPAAYALLDRIVAEFPETNWYRERATLVAFLAGNRGGAALKERQYETIQYATTHLGGIIPSLTDQVKERFKTLLAVKAEVTA